MAENHVDPEMLAYTCSEHVHDTEPEPEEYLERFVDELFVLEPGLKERFSDQLLTELKEEILRREDNRHVHAVITLIETIEQDWRNHA